MISGFLLKRKVRTAVLSEDNVYEGEATLFSFVLGIMKSKIYLPLRLPATQKAHIVKIHIKRFDTLIKPLAFLVLCVHCFNLLCWLAFALILKGMELCCDEAVIEIMGNGIKCDYLTPFSPLQQGSKCQTDSLLLFVKVA